MEKRGISAVVATVLIILITVAAVTLVWQVVIPMIKDNLDFSALEGRVEIVTSGGYTFYDAVENKASVQVKRGMDDGVMDRVKIIFSVNGSTTESIVAAPAPGNTKVYVFDLSDYGAPDSVSVAPVFILNEKEKEGDITSKIKVKEGETVSGGFAYDVDVDYGARSCSDLLAMGYTDDGLYEIDPDGDNPKFSSFEIYCDMAGGGIEWMILDGENGDTSGWTGTVTLETTEAHAGSNSFSTSGWHVVTSSGLLPIDTNKNYHLEGWFKSGGNPASRLYFGFIPYDKDGKFISHASVVVQAGSETTLYEDVNTGDKIVKITDGTNWNPYWHSVIAFDIDDSGNYNDLPNYKLSNYNPKNNVPRVENMGAYWEIEYAVGVGKTYPAGTKVRLHNSGGTYLYAAASYALVPNAWTKYEADIVEELSVGNSYTKWRKGTKYARIMMLANYKQASSTKLQYDDVKLVVT